MSLKWNGDQILSRMDHAQRNAVNNVMGNCIRWAKQNHGRIGPPNASRGGIGWQNKSTDAEGSIQLVQAAVRDGQGWTGQWGSRGVIYFAKLEFEHGGVLRAAAKLGYPTLDKEVAYFYKRRK